MQFSTTLEVYRNTIKTRLRIPTTEDNTEWSNDSIDANINLARNEFWNRARYNAKPTLVYFSSAIGTVGYDLTTKNINNVEFVRFNTGTNTLLVKFIRKEDFLRLTSISQTGTPIFWTKDENKIKLYPAPAIVGVNNIEVYGDKSLSDLDDDTDIDVDIERQYYDLIVEYALALCWQDAEQEAKANLHFAKFEKMYDSRAFQINSNTAGENTPVGLYVDDDVTNERRWQRPIG